MAKHYAEKLVAVMKKDLGVKESPAGSNKCKFNTWFYGRAVSGSKYPWCCASQCYWYHKAGMGKLFYDGKKCAGTQALEAWAIKKKLTVPKNAGRFGDTALFSFGASYVHHVGTILEKLADGTYKVLEGNTSKRSNDNGGKVMIRIRRQSDIKTIYRPKFDQHELVYTNATCRKYANMSIASKSLAKYGKGHGVRWIKDMKNGWSQIINVNDGEIGYIKNCFLKKSGLSTYKKATTIAPAALREKGKLSAKKIKTLHAGICVEVITKGKRWSNVKIAGDVTGYVANSKLKFKK